MMPLRIVLFFALILSFGLASAFQKSGTDSLFQQLNQVIENQDSYVKEKQKRIDQYKVEKESSNDHFSVNLKLYDEYKSFIYDSAFSYARSLQRIAHISSLKQ